MNKRSFDDNIVIAILAGGVGIMLYDVFQLTFQFWNNIIPFDLWSKEFFPKTFAGFTVMLFAVGYALIARFLRKRRNNTSSQDSTNEKTEKAQPNNQPSEPKKIDNQKGSKKFLFFDIILLLGIASCVIYAIYLYTDTDMDKTIYNHSETTFQDTEAKSPNFDITYNFTSTSMSAQNEIVVSAIAKFNQNFTRDFPKIALATKNVTVYFPMSVSYPHPQYKDGHALAESILLIKDDNDQFFKGQPKSILYQAEGDKCTIVTNAVLYSSSDCPPKGKPYIHISSADATYQYHANKITLALTWVLVAFTIVAIREFISNMSQNISRLRKSDIKDETKKHTRK